MYFYVLEALLQACPGCVPAHTVLRKVFAELQARFYILGPLGSVTNSTIDEVAERFGIRARKIYHTHDTGESTSERALERTNQRTTLSTVLQGVAHRSIDHLTHDVTD